MTGNKIGYIYLSVTILLFSTYEVVSKTIVGSVNPFQINFIRFFIGGFIMFSILLVKRDLKISKNDFFLVVLIGIINVVISMNLLQLSLYVPGAMASVVAVIFSSNPIFVLIFSAIIDKERIKLYKIIGLILGLAGIITVFADKFSIGLNGFESPLLVLLSAVFFGLYTVLGRRLSVRIGSLKMNSYSSITGSLVLLPMILIMGMPVLKFNYSSIWEVLYLSIAVTGLAYFAYFKGLSIIEASKGSLVFFVKPVLASIIAIIFIGEKLTIFLFLGIVLIISGILISFYWTSIKEKFQKKLV
ncbi:MAG: DMT family transporter [Clostridia bacterium]|jgi:drug/metabolite transporter (DMT)-like permease